MAFMDSRRLKSYFQSVSSPQRPFLYVPNTFKAHLSQTKVIEACRGLKVGYREINVVEPAFHIIHRSVDSERGSC